MDAGISEEGSRVAAWKLFRTSSRRVIGGHFNLRDVLVSATSCFLTLTKNLSESHWRFWMRNRSKPTQVPSIRLGKATGYIFPGFKELC